MAVSITAMDIYADGLQMTSLWFTVTGTLLPRECNHASNLKLYPSASCYVSQISRAICN